MVMCVLLGPVRSGDQFEITFSSDNSINSTGFYVTYHVINSSMMTSPTDQPITGKGEHHNCQRTVIPIYTLPEYSAVIHFVVHSLYSFI